MKTDNKIHLYLGAIMGLASAFLSVWIFWQSGIYNQIIYEYLTERGYQCMKVDHDERN